MNVKAETGLMKRQMKRSEAFVVGARGSRLSLAQTQGALDFLAGEFPGTKYRLSVIETPGDRDLVTPIEKSAPDFFTRDLDDAVRGGGIDFAVHSAKDLPPRIADDLDWFWLPLREDPRDAWVTREGEKARLGRRSAKLRVGVSSERRAAFARRSMPSAKLLPIRGAVDSRVAQLVEGRFDAVLMAMAGLRRLFGEKLPSGVEVTPIPEDELQPPEAQGRLAVVFRAGDVRMTRMRERFVKAVRFVSAGVGDAGLCTVVGARDIALADVVLYDDLFDRSLIRPENDALADASTKLPRLVHVGKRCGAHSMEQSEITRLICDEARKGRRVVRLKGGDAGLFGRLAEETDALEALRIPFVVRPGVSALTAATTGTGMLLTRRGESRGFTAYTPRSTGEETPVVAFMATKVVRAEARRMIAEGWSGRTPCALVRDAAGPCEDVERATLAAAARGAFAADDPRPGLFIVGSPAARGWPKLGELKGARILATCSDAVWERARVMLEDRGGRPVHWPLIALKGRGRVETAGYDAVVLTSPAAARIFFEACVDDMRKLPKIFTCGSGTDAVLREHGVSSDLMPPSDFSAAGLVREIAKLDLTGWRVLRLRSAKAGGEVARALRKAGAKVDDVVLYDNVPVLHPGPLPPHDAVFFASASAVEVFLAQNGTKALAGKGIYVIGEPTRSALPPRLQSLARLLPLALTTSH